MKRPLLLFSNGARHVINAARVSVLVCATVAATGCGSSSNSSPPDFVGAAKPGEQEKVKEEAATLYSVEKKAFEQNRYLDADEVKKVTQSFDKIAESATPEAAKKIRAMSEAVKSYRAKLEEFKALGGAKVETLKSEKDLDNRIVMIKELMTSSDHVKETCAANDPDPSNLRTVDLEHELLVKIQEQLKFYKAHYGKWKIPKSGPALFDVTPLELHQFNQLAADIKSLGEQQMQIMKKNTEERLNKLKAAQ